MVIGCEFDQTDKKCMLGNRFHGFVSQVNYYSRQLDFNTEIPKINLDPQKVFDPFINVLLLWNEYLLETGSDRIIPSEADVSPCPGRCKTYSGKFSIRVLHFFLYFEFFMPPHLQGRGHIAFGADHVGVCFCMTLSCLHNILWTSGLILTKFSRIYNWDITKNWLD